MSGGQVAPTLETLFNLDRIVTLLKNEGTALSRKKMMGILGLTEEAITPALEHGCGGKYIVWSKYNFYDYKKDFSILEERFYPSVRVGIERLWTSEKYEKNQFYIEETARKDSKIAGLWTRPDFTLVAHKRFPWTIGHEFDVVTFEVKRPDTSNVLAVFEALSHASAATRAYVVFPIDLDYWNKNDPLQAARVKDECSRHGVGLILVENIYIDPTPLHLIKAQKREIDHEKCSDFLSAVMSDSGKEAISKWK